MREIKFRAWDEESKKMMDMQKLCSPIEIEMCSFLDYILTDTENSLFGDYKGKDNYILQQFTGLLDKNGKEIYEGDVVKTEGFTLKVVWYELAACFRYLDNAHNLLSPLNYNDPEIVGNIYENQELLK